MSLFRRIAGAVGRVAGAVAPTLLGGSPLGQALGTVLQSRTVSNLPSSRTIAAPSLAPITGFANPITQRTSFVPTTGGPPPMSALPVLGRVGGAIGSLRRGSAAPGIGSRVGGAIGTIGTVGGVVGTVGGIAGGVSAGRAAGQRRRRRAKGISGSEMKAFTRVTKILNQFCKVPAPTRRRSSKGAPSCR